MLETLNIRPDEIADERLAEAILVLLQLIEQLYEDIEKLKAEVQRLRDENNLLINPFRVLEETRRVSCGCGQSPRYMGKLPPEIEGEFGLSKKLF